MADKPDERVAAGEAANPCGLAVPLFNTKVTMRGSRNLPAGLVLNREKFVIYKGEIFYLYEVRPCLRQAGLTTTPTPLWAPKGDRGEGLAELKN